MRRVKLLGLALMAIFAFGVVIAASASAEEKEPAGILYLPGESGAVTINTSEPGGEVAIETIGLLKVKIKCQKVTSKGEVGGGTGEETHATLGTLEVDYSECTLNTIACSSENILGEKDPEGTILQVKEDTDLHLVSLLDKTKLLAGILVGLLELVEKEKKLDLTINCGGVKSLILGMALLDVKGASPTSDVSSIEIEATELPCDENDKLCILEQKNWAATALLLNPTTKKDELMVCEGGLGTFIKTAEECTKLIIAKPIKATLSKKVLIDF